MTESTASVPPLLSSQISDPTYLSPDDATTYPHSPPRRVESAPSVTAVANGSHLLSSYAIDKVKSRISARTTQESSGRPRRRKDINGREHSRRLKPWKKLLWVKQQFPDNYTDEQTFLEHLERNPRLQPYEFWPLVADFTVIVQHLCSVIIFVCCFVFIFQERISPISVVSVGSFGTILGWIFWDFWVDHEGLVNSDIEEPPRNDVDADWYHRRKGSGNSNGHDMDSERRHLNISTHTRDDSTGNSDTPTKYDGSLFDASGQLYLSPKNQRRLATAKSALLIYCALLGLSPILKSLTKSTTKDSIWAMSLWLMCINVFFFDYSGGLDVGFPASLSTNAALMASTVLASRLPSTTHVFSLTLFSIEVFGLFPVFRRHLRHVSWSGHIILTSLLVVGMGGCVGLALTGGGWRAALVGIILGSLFTCLVMGGCSWWLIGLQKYKNEIRGPWDPARPRFRPNWD
jgi:phosphatidylinositol glycan class C protein